MRRCERGDLPPQGENSCPLREGCSARQNCPPPSARVEGGVFWTVSRILKEFVEAFSGKYMPDD